MLFFAIQCHLIYRYSLCHLIILLSVTTDNFRTKFTANTKLPMSSQLIQTSHVTNMLKIETEMTALKYKYSRVGYRPISIFLKYISCSLNSFNSILLLPGYCLQFVSIYFMMCKFWILCIFGGTHQNKPLQYLQPQMNISFLELISHQYCGII